MNSEPSTTSPIGAGRPEMEPAERRSVVVRVMVRDDEHALLKAAARKTGLSMSSLLRDAGLKAAQAALEEP